MVQQIVVWGLQLVGEFFVILGVLFWVFSRTLLDISIAFHADLQVAFLAIEIAQGKGPDQLWLKGDSLSLAQVFKSHLLVPWRFQNRWINCLSYTK